MDDKPLDDPAHELACQYRAKGMTQAKAYEAAGFNSTGQGNNSSRFFRQAHVKRRVAQLTRNMAIMAELDQGFVLRNLMTVAKLADANLADYFEKDAAGRRTKTSIADVSRAKMHALDEVTVEEYFEKNGDDEQERIRKTKLKLRPLSVAIHATELLGKHLGMWPASSAVTVSGTGQGGAIPVEHRRAQDLTDDELAAIVAAGSIASDRDTEA